MKKIYLCLFLVGLAFLSLTTEAFAWGDDWYVSAANYGRYYHFKETKTDSAATRFQYDIFMGDFYTGGWYEVKHVMNDAGFNSTENELTQRYFGWENDGLTIHAGHFYEVYDRGLVLNTFRDDEVSVDLVLDGIKLNWRRKYFDLDFLSAVRASDDSFRPIIRGARGKLKPLSFFHLGGAYVSYIDISNSRENITQVNERLILDYLDLYAEYAKRKYPVTGAETITGDALYVNSTAYYSYFSALFEYKNYYDMLYPDAGNLNTPPAVNPQDRLLTTEASNVFTPVSGERGYRFNLGFAWNDYWGAEIDYSAARSRSPETVEDDELFAEVRGSLFNDRLVFKAGVDMFNFSFEDVYDSAYIDSTTPETYLTSGPITIERNEIKPEIDIEFLIDDLHSIELNASLIKYDYVIPAMPNDLPDSILGSPAETHYMADSTDYTEKFLSVSFSRLPDIKVTIGGSLSNKEPSSDPEKMAFIEASYKWGNHELIVFQGQQRGGLVCSGGVCTYHPTFEGIRVTLLSRL